MASAGFSAEKLYAANGICSPGGVEITPQLIVVSNNPGSADGHSSIASGLAAAAALAPLATVVHVLPGTPYVETCPLVVPDKCTVSGASNLSVTVVPTNPAAHVFELGNGAAVENIHITGASGAGGVAIYKDCTTGPLLSPAKDLLITNCETGAVGTGASGGILLLVEARIASTGTAPIVTGIRAENGAQVRAINVFVAGNPLHKVTTGMIGTGAGSQMRARGCVLNYCTDGLVGDAGAVAVGTVIVANNCGSTFVLDGSSAATTMDCTEVTVVGSTVADVDVRATAAAAITFSFCRIQWPLVLNPNALPISAVTFGTTAGDTGLQVAGELAVGTSQYPTESAMGSGGPFIHEMAVYTNTSGDSGTWTDVTAAATDFGGASLAFPGTAAGNCVYVGAPREFGGFFVIVDTPVAAGESALLSADYWDGSAWLPVKTMSCGSAPPYTAFSTALFERAASEHVRLGRTPGWATRTVNGSDALFWVRVCATGGLTAAPGFDQIKIHPHSFIVGADGFTQFFGRAREIRALPWKFSDSTPGVNAPANQDLYLGKSLEVGRSLNYFIKGEVDRIGILEPIPSDIDTSNPIKLQLGWSTTSANTGNVRWMFRWSRLADGEAVFGSAADAPATGANEMSTVVLSPAPAAKDEFRVEAPVYLDVSALNSRPATGLGDYLLLSIERDSTHADDTYAGHVAMVSLGVQYVAAFSAGHLLSY